MTDRPGPILGAYYAVALLAASVRLRLALWRVRLWTAATSAALARAHRALADLEPAR